MSIYLSTWMGYYTISFERDITQSYVWKWYYTISCTQDNLHLLKWTLHLRFFAFAGIPWDYFPAEQTGLGCLFWWLWTSAGYLHRAPTVTQNNLSQAVSSHTHTSKQYWTDSRHSHFLPRHLCLNAAESSHSWSWLPYQRKGGKDDGTMMHKWSLKQTRENAPPTYIKELKYFLFLKYFPAAFTQTGKSVQSSLEVWNSQLKLSLKKKVHIKAFAILNYIHYLLKLHLMQSQHCVLYLVDACNHCT